MAYAPGVQNRSGEIMAQGYGQAADAFANVIRAYQQNKALASQSIAKFEGVAAANPEVLQILGTDKAPAEAMKAYKKLQSGGSVGLKDAAILAQFSEAYGTEKQQQQQRAMRDQQMAMQQQQIEKARAEQQQLDRLRQLAQFSQGVGRGVLQPGAQDQMTRQMAENPFLKQQAQIVAAGGSPASGESLLANQTQRENTAASLASRNEIANLNAQNRIEVQNLKTEMGDQLRAAKAAESEARAAGKSKGQTFDDSAKLRMEFLKSAPVLEFQVVDNYLGRGMRVANLDSGPGDVALIYSFIKVLDPASVVREGEIATVQNARSVPDAVRTEYNRILGGQKLSGDKRKEYVGAMKEAAQSQYDRLVPAIKQYTDLSKKYGIDVEDVVHPYYSDWKLPSQEPTPVSGTASGQPSLPAGWKFTP
jgi:hypothetical protein